MSTVRLTRPRHPFDGQLLPVLGRMRRHGEVELLVVLPDGSKRLIPAAWTDLERPPGGTDAGDGPATLGSVPDLLGLSVLISDLSARSADGREQAARKSPCKEDDHAACPAQSAAGPGSGATPGHHRPASRPAGSRGGHAAGRPDRQGGRDGGRESGGRR
ncbi:MAG: hypothetical protein JO037_12730 [Actinobacteria bacterium]|nr:hypothetical protein [Actinomycetota bacterium]